MRMTLFGMYSYMPTLFDGMVVPETVNKDALINQILKDSGELFPYHQVPPVLKVNIEFYFTRKADEYRRIAEALNADYNPIENFDRYEEYTDNTNGSNQSESNSEQTGSQNGVRSGSEEDSRTVAAYDSSTYQNRDKDTHTYNNVEDNTSYEAENNSTISGSSEVNSTHTGHLHGNIGLTSNQSMIISETTMRREYCIYDIIAQDFEREFLMQVY